MSNAMMMNCLKLLTLSSGMSFEIGLQTSNAAFAIVEKLSAVKTSWQQLQSDCAKPESLLLSSMHFSVVVMSVSKNGPK